MDFSTLWCAGSPMRCASLIRFSKITPNDVDTLALKAAVAQAEGDLPRAAALLAPLRPAPADPAALETQIYQAILEADQHRLFRD